MANNYFQFKQFTIHQEKCAMKVCTDACLFGAYIAHELEQVAVNNILDIGSGTGVLSIMLAQKTTTIIDSVEIDPAAFEQAKENIAQSPFHNRINIFNADIVQFNPEKKYDYIVSNPPFFEADLKSEDGWKNAARHGTTLTYTGLLNAIDKNLNDRGGFAVLLPYHRSNYFEAASAALDFHPVKKILVRQTPGHNYFRSMLIFSRKRSPVQQNEISVKYENGNYSEEFISLLKDYYLYL